MSFWLCKTDLTAQPDIFQHGYMLICQESNTGQYRQYISVRNFERVQKCRNTELFQCLFMFIIIFMCVFQETFTSLHMSVLLLWRKACYMITLNMIRLFSFLNNTFVLYNTNTFQSDQRNNFAHVSIANVLITLSRDNWMCVTRQLCGGRFPSSCCVFW